MVDFPSVFFLMAARHPPKNESGLHCSYLTKLIQPLSLHKVSSSLNPNTPINTDGLCLCKQVYFPSCVIFTPLLEFGKWAFLLSFILLLRFWELGLFKCCTCSSLKANVSNVKGDWCNWNRQFRPENTKRGQRSRENMPIAFLPH